MFGVELVEVIEINNEWSTLRIDQIRNSSSTDTNETNIVCSYPIIAQLAVWSHRTEESE